MPGGAAVRPGRIQGNGAVRTAPGEMWGAKVAELWRAGLVAGLAADWARGVAKSARLARARVVRSGRSATDPEGSDAQLEPPLAVSYVTAAQL